MRIFRAALLAAAMLRLASGGPLRALLIDAPTWQAQTPSIKAILESGDVFRVDVLTAPAKGAAFNPDFERYKVIVLNYGADTWPLATIASLQKYINNGGGLAALAPADAAFPEWTEYNLMLGISGAPNRNKSAGPIWFYQSGNLAYSNDTESPAGQAPSPDQPFAVTIRNTDHPVAKGLPLIWMHAADKLFGNLRGPGKNMTVLATAHSDADHGGTGREEPVLLGLTYGKGRVFHSLLGSTADGISCAGFQTFLQRGAEWAASGKVTTRVPSDFPSEDKVSTRSLK